MTKTRSKIKPIINKSEIARRLQLTPQYVGQLLNPNDKKRKNPDRLKAIGDLIHSELHLYKKGKAA